MPHALNPLVCLNAGEFAPAMDSRIDLPTYRKACRKLRNMVPMKQGGATRRPGSQYIANGQSAQDGTSPAVSRLEKFQYAPGTTFILEFCDGGIRFYSNGAQEQVSSPQPWATGTAYPDGSFATDGPTTYYLYNGPLTPSTVTPSADPSHWRAQTAYEVPAPYSATNFTAPNYWASDVFVLQTKQINDVVYIVHPNFPVWKLIRYSDSNWVMQQVQFLTPALLNENVTDITLTSGATTGTTSLTATAPAWVTATSYVPGNAVTSGAFIYVCLLAHTSGVFATDFANGDWKLTTLFLPGHTGSYWQLAYNRPSSNVPYALTANGTSATLQLVGTWEVQTYGTWTADISIQASYDNGVTWQVITTLTSRNDANYDITGQDISGGIYRLVITNWVAATSATPPRVVLTADNQFVYGLVQITTVAPLFPYNAAVKVIIPLFSTNPTQYWSEGAWSNVRGYPATVTIFQERAWYAATEFQPQRIWATQTDDLENFALVDQSEATYGMAFDLNAPGRGPIQWLSAQTDLFAGLAGAEWVITSGQQSAPITPTQVIALEHSVNGSTPNLPGLIIGNACFYVQRKGAAFQQMLFSVFTNKYMSQDMQVLAQHLTAAGVKQFDFQQQFQNQSVLWAVCGDGTLISLTYAMDQEVFGWAKHTTGDGSDVGFLSVQVIYGAAGQDDEVWVTVLRAGNKFCTIERLNSVDWQVEAVGQPDLRDAVYADCSVKVTSPGSNVIPGLPTFLAGRAAVAGIVPVAGGGMFGIDGLTVANDGSVTIPNYTPAVGDVVIIGLPILWTVQPMRLDVLAGGAQVPALRKAISKLYLRLLNSIGGDWATKEGDVIPLPAYPITQNSGNPPPFVPNVPVEVELDVGGLMQYANDPVFIIQGSKPLPFQILGITVKSDVGGAP